MILWLVCSIPGAVIAAVCWKFDTTAADVRARCVAILGDEL